MTQSNSQRQAAYRSRLRLKQIHEILLSLEILNKQLAKLLKKENVL